MPPPAEFGPLRSCATVGQWRRRRRGEGIKVHSSKHCAYIVSPAAGEIEPSSQNRQAAAAAAANRPTLVATSLKGRARAHLAEMHGACVRRRGAAAESGQLIHRMVPIFGRWIGQKETARTAQQPLTHSPWSSCIPADDWLGWWGQHSESRNLLAFPH